MAGMLIPEGIIEDSLQKALEFIRADYNAASNKENSVLLRMTNNQSIGSFNYSEQLVKSLITTKSDPKHIRVKQSYNPEDTSYPSVYINMNEESEKYGSLGQGIGDHGLAEGEYASYVDDSPTTSSDIFARRYDSSFFITIVGDNKNEVIGLYQFFKLIITAIGYHFEQSGIQNVHIGGRGITFDSRVPSGVMIKVISMSFNYEAYSHDFYSKIVPSLINISGQMVEQ